MMPWEEHLENLLDRAWEQELATFFGDLAQDLADGFISVETALYRIEQIIERKPK